MAGRWTPTPCLPKAADCLRANRVAEARALFARAAAAGSRKAAVIHCNLVASGVDWDEGLAAVALRWPRSSPRCRRELEIVEAMTPGPPRAGEVVGETPHVVLFRKLFTEAECRYLIEAATRCWRRRSWSTPRPAGSGPIRCGSRTGWAPPCRLKIPRCTRSTPHRRRERHRRRAGRAAAGAALPPGGEYKPHFDAIPGFANQRILTMIVWLNEDYEGGETMFLKTGAKVRGGPATRCGSATRCRTGRAIPTPAMPACPSRRARS